MSQACCQYELAPVGDGLTLVGGHSLTSLPRPAKIACPVRPEQRLEFASVSVEADQLVRLESLLNSMMVVLIVPSSHTLLQFHLCVMPDNTSVTAMAWAEFSDFLRRTVERNVNGAQFEFDIRQWSSSIRKWWSRAVEMDVQAKAVSRMVTVRHRCRYGHGHPFLLTRRDVRSFLS